MQSTRGLETPIDPIPGRTWEKLESPRTNSADREEQLSSYCWALLSAESRSEHTAHIMQLIFITTLQERAHFLIYLSDTENEAQRGQLTSSRSCESVERPRSELVILKYLNLYILLPLMVPGPLLCLSSHVSGSGQTFR